MRPLRGGPASRPGQVFAADNKEPRIYSMHLRETRENTALLLSV
jgi:hypothetical protein